MPGPIRTALKVDLDKPAKDQPYLHVCIEPAPTAINY